MAPALGLDFGLLVSWLFVVAKVVAISFILTGGVFFVVHNRGVFRSLRPLGVFSLCLGLGALLFLDRNAPANASVEEKANGILKLPETTHVLPVREREWAGVGSVTFELPATHSVNFWLDTVWKMNVASRSSIESSPDVRFHLTGNERRVSSSQGRIAVNQAIDSLIA